MTFSAKECAVWASLAGTQKRMMIRIAVDVRGILAAVDRIRTTSLAMGIETELKRQKTKKKKRITPLFFMFLLDFSTNSDSYIFTIF